MLSTAQSAKRHALLATQTSAQLLEARRGLDARTDLTGHERLASAWIADELHRRYPATVAIVERYFEDESESREYGDLLAAALLELGVEL